MKFYLFAKFFTQMSVPELMEYCASAGIDGPTALVREGYPLPPDMLAEGLPGYIAEAEANGLEVKYADTPIDFNDPALSDRMFGILAQNGIELIRLQYISKNSPDGPRALAGLGRRFAETAAEYGRRHSVRSVIQLHGGFYPHNATAAWPMVKDLDPRYVGIKIDPGNNLAQEGYEHWDYQVGLLGEYIAALGAKDAAHLRNGDPDSPSKGWSRPFVPAYEGMADYRRIYSLLHAAGFASGESAIPSILMPFYHEKEPELLMRCLEKEIKYLKTCASGGKNNG
ncbi:MAG: sugar phosphate isomerase/epimerase [Clostridiales bacterium]|nr:sugar phosphate isomerase/epimerase [Clostridiales bacterium]